MASHVVVILVAMPLRIIDVKKKVLAYLTYYRRYQLALLVVGKNVYLFVNLEKLHDLVLPQNKNLEKVAQQILSDVNYHLVEFVAPVRREKCSSSTYFMSLDIGRVFNFYID